MHEAAITRAPTAAGVRPRPDGAGRRLLRGLRGNVAVLAALSVVLLLAALAVAAPFLPIANPNTIATSERLQWGRTSDHPLGTDEFGRDLLSRLIWGGRVSLLAGVGSMAGALVAGTTLGLAAGFYGGRLDHWIMRGAEILQAFPYILLAIALVAALGPGLFHAMLAITIVGMPIYIRLIRGAVLAIREHDYVQAARAMGARNRRIVGQHILPNVLAPIIVTGTLDIGAKIVATSGLSFLGLGTQPPTADWGTMLANGQQFLSVAPHVATLPGLAVFVVVLSFNLVGDWLRDALDPRLRGA
ncbi:MAG TPA: ABC transporter permease [bacterium]|nr:ABC transporter permease [bacterium]